MRRYPPGPRDKLCGITFFQPLKTNPLGFASKVARDYGDFAYIRLGWINLYLSTAPS